MRINGVSIDDTFAEAFPMKATRIVITAATAEWALQSARAATGFATSVIACGCEAGIEREIPRSQTPDGRPGVAVLVFAMSTKDLAKQIQARVGQCVLTSPSSACFSGMDEGDPIPLGRNLRYFGDGFQSSKLLGDTRYWRVPVMDGEFVCQETTRVARAIGGGNFLVLAATQAQALTACERAVAAMRRVRGVVMPFPGGIVRSGSKVGSRYPGLPASTNQAYCPTLRGQVDSALGPEVGAVLEIVIDGLDEAAIREATRQGILAACSGASRGGVLRISAGNYGGDLGPYHFRLRDIMR